MRFTSRNDGPPGMILILSWSLLARSQYSYPSTAPLAPDNSTSQANCTFDRDPNALPPVPPWAGSLQAPPKCAVGSCPTVFNSCCTSTKCTMTFIGACMQQGTMINRECGCPDFDASGCVKCTDNALGKAEYYRWLNITCGDVDGWDGLPKDWTKANSSLDLVYLGEAEVCLDNRYYPCRKCGDPDGYYAPHYCVDENHMLDYAGYLTPELNVPPCVWRDCPVLWGHYNASLADKEDFYLLDLDPAITTDREDGRYYLERSFCATSSHLTCPGMCASPSEQSDLILWLNNTCAAYPAFPGLPSNWTAIVSAGAIVPDSPEAVALHLVPSDRIILDVPSCLFDTCRETLTRDINTTAEVYCQLDASGRFCTRNNTLVSLPTFCSPLSYPATCPESCLLAFDRPTWLSFLNTTCSPAFPPQDFTVLPQNWTSLLNVLISDLRPWPTVVSPDLSEALAFSTSLSCPSAAANLGVFAAVNIAMLIITPILGRRTVVSKLTFGILGKPHSQGWMLMGPLTAMLQTSANLLNAALIRSTPGYAGTSMTTILLLWFSRPRLAWLSVGLVGFQSGRAMYLSVAATSLTAEMILQLLSVYTMGFVANHARKQGFYKLGNYQAVITASGDGDDSTMGTDAMAMYAGALLWLIVVIITLAIVGKAVFDVNVAIGNFKWTSGLDIFSSKKEGKLRDEIEELKRQVDRAERDVGTWLDNTTLTRTLMSRNQKLAWEEISRQIRETKSNQTEEGQSRADWTRRTEYRRVRGGGQQGALDVLLESLGELRNCASEREGKYKAAVSRLGEGQFAEGRGNDDQDMVATRQEADDLAASIGYLATDQIDILEWTKAQAKDSLSRIDPRRDDKNNALAAKHARVEERNCWYVHNHVVGSKNESGVVALTAESKAAWRRWKDIADLTTRLERLWAQRRKLPTGTQWILQTQSKLRRVVLITIFGMFGCWIAQWLFWVGFVRLYTPDG
ncbi:hypothetical protein QBC37DRAFT_457539 [Rhypophila decipiens]|uniref:TRP C-terminal domain-containing protein n=1 Tax=Rhypophila decipiens TaxID=261697 RepID=A0AAN6XYC5_9PEZI|nr:hypothetical protein QBC37DRAFT_457539 [Rhypophila decipiens]